jgi:protein-tyrosine-phosphatase
MPERLPPLLFVCVGNARRSPGPKPLDDAGLRAGRDRIERMARELIANVADPANRAEEPGR